MLINAFLWSNKKQIMSNKELKDQVNRLEKELFREHENYIEALIEKHKK